MIPRGTRIVASVQGSFDVLKAPGLLAGAVRAGLEQFGAVVSVDVQTALFSDGYVGRVVYVTKVDHASIEDIRGVIAGVFQGWNGIRPAVSFPSEGTPANPASPFAGLFDGLPDLGDLNVTIALVAVAAVVVLVVVVKVKP
ncbi:MAG: hypothetical protein ACRD15_17755 [Vicinamibacterales bacterium]